MFNVGSQEVLIVLILVFLLFGPRHIPEVAQTLGRGIGELKRTLGGVEEGIRRTASELPDLSDPEAKPPTYPPKTDESKPFRATEEPPPAGGLPDADPVPRSKDPVDPGAAAPPAEPSPNPAKESDGP